MLNLTILCVGGLKERYLRDACAEYEKRLGAFCRLQITEVPEERCGDRPGAAEIRMVLQKEGERLLQKIPAHARVIALCIEGTQAPSESLAAKLAACAVAGESRVCFVIGGSYGLSDEVKAAARERMSMSQMTFPHQLARVMLLEQIYRAFKINQGGTYHK